MKQSSASTTCIHNHNVFIGLGSNMGDRARLLRKALAFLDQDPCVWVRETSPWFETEPVGGPPQGRYVNGAVRVETSYNPDELLKRLKSIERRLGRGRGPRNGPRPIDLDILLFDERILDTPELVIPHPRIAERLFVLAPLAEIAGSRIHPGLGSSIEELLKGCHEGGSYCRRLASLD